jgi:prevent-host-death family protein
MARTVSLRDANQNFAKYVRAVEAGEEFVITRRGAPVARLAPAAATRRLTPDQQAARRRLVARLRKGWRLRIGKIDRDALHER